jgi:hypothetical protein
MKINFSFQKLTMREGQEIKGKRMLSCASENVGLTKVTILAIHMDPLQIMKRI